MAAADLRAVERLAGQESPETRQANARRPPERDGEFLEGGRHSVHDTGVRHRHFDMAVTG